MNFFNERPADDPYDPHAQQCTDHDELLAITPDDTLRWLNLRTYGDQAPAADMQPRTSMARSQSIKFWKMHSKVYAKSSYTLEQSEQH